jgi:hypothetical protein
MSWRGTPFPNGYPIEESKARLLDELFFQRAVQVHMGGIDGPTAAGKTSLGHD